MFHSISWQSYWAVTFTACGVYYLILYFFYFRRDNRTVLQLRKKSATGEDPGSFGLPERSSETVHKESEKEYHVVHACIDELNAFFDNQKRCKPLKNELLHGLHALLEKYPTLTNSEYKDPIIRLVITQCQNICSIHLSAEELGSMWLGS